MSVAEKRELTVKVLQGPLAKKREVSKWKRFDRLQRSLRPLRKGHHLSTGLYYGRQFGDQRS